MNRQIVFNELKNNQICVFHNEVIARYFAIEYAYEYDVIEADRVISYDTFRDFFLPSHEGLKEVNNQIREFFLIDFFRKNKLKYLINNEYPESISRFTSYLVIVIQQLKRLKESDVFNTLEANFIYDVDLLYEKYCEFLEINKLFEPSFENPSLEYAPKSVLENSYTIISSDTKAGCKQLLNNLNNPSFIKTIEIENLEENNSFYDNFNLYSYENSEELQNNLLRKVKELLDTNIPSRDIAITLCNFDSDILDIEYKAKRYNIPISKAKGYPLLKYPGGKFLSYLSNLYDNNFSLDDMKSFFLDRSFPFKDISLNRELIRSAIDANIDHGSNIVEQDYWTKRLSIKPNLREYYWKFKNIIIKINTVETISELQKSLHILESLIFVENVGWKDSSGEKSYSFAIDKLDKLREAMQICKIAKSKQLFKIFNRLIEKENYVEQGKRDGIRIYEYPLSASIDIPYHFIVDINSKNCEVIDKPLFLLPPSIDDQDLREEEDLTSNVIKDYCFNSGLSIFLFSNSTYDGAQIAPSLFMEKDRIQKSNLQFNNKPYIDEIDLWNTNNKKKDLKLTAFQSEAFEKASINVLDFNDNGYVNNNMENDVNEYLLDRIKSKDNYKMLNFSSTSINLFKKCPYAYAIKYLFKVQKNEYDVIQYDALEIGTRIHKIFENFFRKIKEEDGQFYSSKYNEYLSLLLDIQEAEFKDYFMSKNSPPFSTQIYIKDRFKNLARDFLNVEIKVFDTFRSTDMEKKYESIEEIKINGKSYFYSLNGKIDRVINQNNGDYAIVDYKSGHTPISASWHKKAYDEAPEELPDYQFPCYKKLLAKDNKNVSIASYYSVTSAKYCDMWNLNKPDNLEIIDTIFDKVMTDIITQILDGNYKATPSKETCQHCDYRQVCRKRYSTK
ncbi:MAG: PD-(D/E)XK nuclease family protein [Pleomorphochaeta sp.]